MPKSKKPVAGDTKLKAFIASGGRKGAEADFDAILKRAAKPNKDSKPKKK